MKVLQCHNYYQQPGGEDRVVAEEASLLRHFGHEVEQYLLHNDAVSEYGKLRLLGNTLWNRQSKHKISQIIETFKPDVVHVHNTLPLMSPSIYYAARDAGVAVVQTLHNYRMVCPGATCMREGKTCELCVSKRIKWPAIQHGCYRNSKAASGAVVGMLAFHQAIGTWKNAVDRYVTCSDFARMKLIESGFDAQLMASKPNFLMQGIEPGDGSGGYVMYLGRLSREKGIATLLKAWDRDDMHVPLHIVGGGPMADEVEQVAKRRESVTYLGHCSRKKVEDELRQAAILVFPSVNYEGMPMTLLEAMQVGTPVIGSRLGAIPEVVIDGQTGRCVTPNDSAALYEVVNELVNDPTTLQAMRATSQRVYEDKYAKEAIYEKQIAIYEAAIAHRLQKTKSRKNKPTVTGSRRTDAVDVA